MTDAGWCVRESELPGARAAASVLTVANGRLGVRGCLEEGPDECRGTFLAGVFETHPLSYPEEGFGHPDQGEAMVPVADGTILELLADGRTMDVEDAVEHERELDLRSGVLRRTTTWEVAGGRLVLVAERLVSADLPGSAALRCTLRSDVAVRVELASAVAANAGPPVVDNADPRVAEALTAPFVAEGRREDEHGGALAHRTRGSGIGVAVAVRHTLPDGASADTRLADDTVLTHVTLDLRPGAERAVTKHLAYASGVEERADALLDRATREAADAQRLGWEELERRQRRALDALWERAGIVIEGDAGLERAVRFSIFQLWQATARIENAPVGAKGLTGAGYSGHTFWDIEGFVLPVLAYLDPDAARRLLQWRSSTLDVARERARTLGVDGAVFAWRTLSGRETSAYWPASTAAMHANADIARAYELYGRVTGHDRRAVGALDILVDAARLWASLGCHDPEGRWHLFGMTGPDEYTGVVDDNVFTNLMAARTLESAADAVGEDADGAARLGVGADEVERWRHAAATVHIPYDEVRRVHPACAGFTDYAEWDFEANRDRYPVQEHAHYFTIYRHQVVKQADLVQALWWCEDAFDDDQIARDLAYYEARTVRDSSLSAAVQAVVCARVGHLDLAYAYWREAALVDLHDLQDNTEQGLHLASLGGTWLAMVNGFGGVRERGRCDDVLRLAPALPPRLTRLGFRLAWRDHLLDVAIDREAVTLSLPHHADGPLQVELYDDEVTIDPGGRVRAELRTPTPPLPTPTQPAGREPRA